MIVSERAPFAVRHSPFAVDISVTLDVGNRGQAMTPAEPIPVVRQWQP
jgi:hypothetical protein